MVQLLLDHGALVDAADHKLERPLHLAVRCRTSLCAAQRQIVELLCDNGADVNAVNKKVMSVSPVMHVHLIFFPVRPLIAGC